jgi:hypothetical protein
MLLLKKENNTVTRWGNLYDAISIDNNDNLCVVTESGCTYYWTSAQTMAYVTSGITVDLHGYWTSAQTISYVTGIASGVTAKTPVVIGTINANGTIDSGTGNFTCVSGGTSGGTYTIAIDNVTYKSGYSTVVTTISNGLPSAATTFVGENNLIVFTYVQNVLGVLTLSNQSFDFVVYKN